MCIKVYHDRHVTWISWTVIWWHDCWHCHTVICDCTTLYYYAWLSTSPVLHCITMPDCWHLLYYIVLLCLIVNISCITLYYYAWLSTSPVLHCITMPDCQHLLSFTWLFLASSVWTVMREGNMSFIIHLLLIIMRFCSNYLWLWLCLSRFYNKNNVGFIKDLLKYVLFINCKL